MPTEIPAEAEDIEGVRGAEAQGFPIGARIEIPEGRHADGRDHNKCDEGPDIAAAVIGEEYQLQPESVESNLVSALRT